MLTVSSAVLDQNFDIKAQTVLDDIFSQYPQLRQCISVLTPRECHDREIRLSVSSDDKAAAGESIHVLLSWIRDNGLSQLLPLMLF